MIVTGLQDDCHLGEAKISSTLNFTGQRDQGYGLIDYGARFYSPALGRFTSPGTLVPDPYNPLDWDRYQYARANPLKFVDPTGHKAIEDWNDGQTPLPPTPTPNPTLASVRATQTRQSQSPFERVKTPERICTIPPTITSPPQVYNPAPTATPTLTPLTWSDVDEAIDDLTKPDFGPTKLEDIWEYLPDTPIVIPKLGIDINPKHYIQAVEIAKDVIWSAKEAIKSIIVGWSK